MSKIINGKNIECAFTGRSMYDNNSLIVVIKDETYLIKADEILKLLKLAKFTGKKAIKHTYLSVVE